MVNENDLGATENKIKTYRWFFYISSIQLLSFFMVPAFVFPGKFVLHIEFISALTLGLVVAQFYLLVNICGLFVDKSRRLLYLLMIIFVGLLFLWAAISWSYIEHMDYILR
jgi:hypothetical protein